MNARMKARKNARNALAISFDLPSRPVLYSGPMFSFSAALVDGVQHAPARDVPGVMFALIVTWRVRPRRLIWAGPVPCSKRTTSSNGTVPNLFDGTVTIFSSSSRLRASATERTWTSYCSPRSV